MIRRIEPSDIEAVVDIYNQAIEAGFQTAFTQKLAWQDKVEWFEEHLHGNYPMFVAVCEGQVTGWLSLSPYRQGRAALSRTVEISYFVHVGFRARGIGSQLLACGLQACRELGYKTVLAIIIDQNQASIALAKKYGFEQWAFLPEVAAFNGVVCSHVYLGLHLSTDR